LFWYWLTVQKVFGQLPYAILRVTKIVFRETEKVGGIRLRSSHRQRLDHWQNFRVLEPQKITLELNGFGKFCVRHRPGIRWKIGYTGLSIQTKMKKRIRLVSLGKLRQQERDD
jgi:nucleoid DNA-binding protein